MKNLVRWSWLPHLALAFAATFVFFQSCGKFQSSSLSSVSHVDPLNVRVDKLRTLYCLACHDGSSSAPDPKNIMDDNALVQDNWLKPGDPAGSPLYASLLSSMPKGGARLSTEDLKTFEQWILSMALPPANLTVTDDPLFNFGSIVIGGSTTHDFTVINTGGLEATNVLIGNLNLPFSIDPAGTCLSTIAAATSCTVRIRFSPTAVTTSNQTMLLSYSDGVSSAPLEIRRDLTGAGSSVPLANLSFAAGSSGAFGIVALSSSKDLTLTLENTGGAAATTLSVGALNAPFSRQGGSCGASLAMNSTCTMILRYAPTVTGASTASLTVSYNNGTSTQNISLPLSGQGAGGTSIYYSEVRNILDTSACNSCHTGVYGSWGTTRGALLAFKFPTSQATAAIVPSNANSRFVLAITSGTPAAHIMGQTAGYGTLSASNKQKIIDWIVSGAPDDPAGTPAVLTISDAPTYNFGSVITGQMTAHTFTVTNSGGSSASAIAPVALVAPYSFVGGTYPGTGGTCAATLAAAATCTVAVRYSPTVTGAQNSTLRLNYNDSVTAQNTTRAVTGTGTGAPVANLHFATGASGAFGVVAVSTDKNLTLTLTNTGNATATAIGVAALSAPFSRQGGTCGTSVAISSSCTLIMRFSPTAAVSSSATLTVTYSNGVSTQNFSLPLTGQGAGGTSVFYSEVRNILNSSACNACHTGVNGNWGTTRAALLAFKFPTSQATAAIIPSNANSRFILAITSGTPAAHVMGQTAGYGTLSVSNKQKIIDWIVSGAPDDPAGTPALLAISDAPTYAFGSVISGQMASHTFTVTNSGGSTASAIAPVALIAPYSFAGGAYPGTGGTCTTTLASTATCTMVVRFSPTTTGALNANLRLNYNDSVAAQNATRAMTGTGTGAPIADLQFASGTLGSFANVVVGGYSSLTLTLHNNGAANATAIVVSGLGTGPFFRTGGTCGVTLAASASCTIALRYEPLVNGNHAAPLAIGYSSGVASRSLPLALSGHADPVPVQQVLYPEVRAILTAKCLSCHTGTFGNWGTSHSSLLAFRYPTSQSTSSITPFDSNSRIIKAITTGTPAGHIMGRTTGYGALTGNEVAKIRTWVIQGALGDSYPTYFKPVLGDRYYVTSVFGKVFGETVITSGLVNNVLNRADFFGSACQMQELSFVGTSNTRVKNLPIAGDGCFATNANETRLNADPMADSSVIAESTRISICMNITSSLANTDRAVSLAGLTATTSVFDADTVTAAYSRFYPGAPPSPAVVSALISIGQEAQLKLSGGMGSRTREGWRFIMMTLCASPAWKAP